MSADHIPGRTPRTVELLLRAGQATAERVRGQTLRGPRPVFLYYIAHTFDALADRLARGLDPRPRTPAEQLCLHLMISHAQRSLPAPDGDLIRLHRALLADRAHETLAQLCVRTHTAELGYDFVALGDALTPSGMRTFFAPLDSPDLVA
jgi:hypothetical protein